MGLPRFLSELKRRKVYRVAVVYSAVGWALLEAAAIGFSRLDGQRGPGGGPPRLSPSPRLCLGL